MSSDAPPRSDRLTPKSPTAIVLMLVNLIPIVGVFAFDWNVGTILAIYWLENVAIGVINVFKIIAARGDGSAEEATVAPKLILVPFFCVHYGGFAAGHAAFVFGFFGGAEGFAMDSLDSAVASIAALWVPFAAMLVSHLLSFFLNFLGRGEYLVKTPMDMMFAPYARVVVLHVTILFGGMIVMFLGSPKPVILLLVLAKTFGDTHFHLREHNRIAEETSA